MTRAKSGLFLCWSTEKIDKSGIPKSKSHAHFLDASVIIKNFDLTESESPVPLPDLIPPSLIETDTIKPASAPPELLTIESEKYLDASPTSLYGYSKCHRLWWFIKNSILPYSAILPEDDNEDEKEDSEPNDTGINEQELSDTLSQKPSDSGLLAFGENQEKRKNPDNLPSSVDLGSAIHTAMQYSFIEGMNLPYCLIEKIALSFNMEAVLLETLFKKIIALNAVKHLYSLKCHPEYGFLLLQDSFRIPEPSTFL
jgi:ATP-dependent exoDNAse (exonuclease V) beta subunit